MITPPCTAIQRASRSVGSQRGDDEAEHRVPGEHVAGRDEPRRRADRGAPARIGLAPGDDGTEHHEHDRGEHSGRREVRAGIVSVSPSHETRSGMFQIASRVTTPPFAFVIECSAPGTSSVIGTGDEDRRREQR